MSELYEIESKYRPLELDDYEAENTWSGKIIVEEDGWFEGIIREKTEEDVDIFVFGIYLPESRIEVHTISPYIDRRATVYNGRKSLDTFFGRYEIEDENFSYQIGEAIVKTTEIDDAYFLCTAKELESRIKDFKECTLSKSSKLPNYQKLRAFRDEAYKINFKNDVSDDSTSFYDELEALFFDTHITPLNLSMKDPLDLS